METADFRFRPATARLMTALVLVLAFAGTARAGSARRTKNDCRSCPSPTPSRRSWRRTGISSPYEVFKSQVAPFDVLPFVKPHHWSTITLDMRANEEDYDGFLQTEPVMMPGMPLQVVYRRDSRLIKEQRRSLSQQVLLTRIPKEWTLDLVRPGALRPDASWQASLSVLEPNQMLIVVLSKDSTNHLRRGAG